MDINRNIIYDKFLVIEGFAYRGKMMVEKCQRGRAIDCYKRILKEMRELQALLKVENGFDSSTEKNNS